MLATTLFVVANLLAVADMAGGRRLLPGLVAIGAIAQTVLLVLVADRGITWVVYGQLVAMAVLVAALAVPRWWHGHACAEDHPAIRRPAPPAPRTAETRVHRGLRRSCPRRCRRP